ncbi:transposase [Pseudomonas zeae]|uniref:transposase n=1 Tax=Pseudomonas zeae TaxID=2745510 RepID=UPI0039E1EB89
MRQRSSYPKPFQAQVVRECLQLGATVSSVAINHGIMPTSSANGCRSSETCSPRPRCQHLSQ